MLTLHLYTQFGKKEASTKRPPANTPTLSVTGILKEPCSIMNPTVNIKRLTADAMPFMFTYARWVEADRFYFIEDWSWIDGLWQVQMKEDVLATFRTQIGAASEYVLRTDSTTNFNGEITDTAYPATTDTTVQVMENANPFTPDSITTGTYIVGIISGGSSYAVGAISYYAMSSAEFGALKNKLFSNDNLEIMGIIDSGGQQLVQDLSQEVLKTLYNPYQYIASCQWVPIDAQNILYKEYVTSINIGWWAYPLTGYRLTATSMTVTENDIALPSHPQIARGSYLNYSPYTKRTITGKFGSVPLDNALFIAGDSIRIIYYIDLITGRCRAVLNRIRTNAMDFILQREFELGVPIQIAQVGTDYLGAAATVISAGATAAQQFATLNIGGGIATAATGIYNTVQSVMPQLETSGSNGSFLNGSNMTKMVTVFYNIVDEDIHHKGRPLCEIRQLNTLSGYILCADGEFDISCYDNERKEIIRYLTTGFFWE